MAQKGKIIIVVPDLNKPGGVSALYNILKLNDETGVEYFELKTKVTTNKLLELIIIYIKFIKKCFSKNIIHVNPSLDKKSFIRDGLFVFIARLFRKNILVYWHGWQEDFENKIDKKSFLKFYFNCSFLRADMHVVLGTVFKEKLVAKGINESKIRLESNAADYTYIEPTELMPKAVDKEGFTILFIARIVKEKGVYIAIDAFKNIVAKTKVRLIIAGTGDELERAKKYVDDNKISNVDFVGHVSGLKKHETFITGDILLFPTYYPEGMPVAIIEAVCYGLPVVSTTVGGIPDWIAAGKNGFTLNSKDPSEFSKSVERLIDDKTLFKKISKTNIEYGHDHFSAEKVRGRIMSYYDSLK